MNSELITYLIKSTYVFTLIYLMYKLIFSRTTFFQLNRFLLLLIVPFSVLIPLVTIPSSTTVEQFQVLLPEISANLVQTENTFSFNLIYLFIAISSLLSIFLLAKIIRILYYIHLIKKGKKHNIQPFSFFGFIHVPENISNENKTTILAHEKVHANQYHSLDVLVYEIYKVIFWFNPLVWLASKDIKANHEYIADKAASKSNINSYSKVLVAQLLGVNCSDLANNFNYEPLIKKRIKMMKTKQTNKLSAIGYALIAPVAIVAFLSAGNVNVTASTPAYVPVQNEKDKVHDKVDQMPEFKGGQAKMVEYIGKHLVYPKDAGEGKVFVSFIVTKKGKIESVEVVKGVNKRLDEEAKKVISSMPDWNPGKNEGKAVSVKMTLPIMYKLK